MATLADQPHGRGKAILQYSCCGLFGTDVRVRTACAVGAMHGARFPPKEGSGVPRYELLVSNQQKSARFAVHFCWREELTALDQRYCRVSKWRQLRYVRLALLRALTLYDGAVGSPGISDARARVVKPVGFDMLAIDGHACLQPLRQISVNWLRVMSYNIHAWRDCDHKDNFDRIVEAVQLVNPDICCLNEVLHPFVAPGGLEGSQYYENVKDGKGRGLKLPSDHLPAKMEDSFLYRLAKHTGLDYLEYGAADPVESSFGRVPFGNAILSRFPFKSCTHVPLEVEDGDVELGYQERDIVDPRQAIVATIDVDGKKFGVISTHLDQKSEELRGKQTMKVIKAVNRILSSDHPKIICGDFNSFRRKDIDRPTWEALCELYKSRSWGQPNEV